MSAKPTKKLIISMGDYGAGKTSFAKWYAQKNEGLFIDFELLYFEKQEKEEDRFDIFVKRLASTIKESTGIIFTMDGYKAITGGHEELADPTFTYLGDKLDCDIQLCLCFAAPHVIHQRQEAKAGHVSESLPREEDEIKRNTYSLYNLAITTDPNPLFVDTTDGFHLVSKEDWPQRWQELVFLSELEKKPHDKFYQDIELPSGLTIPGYSRSHESWERFNQLIDFRDKDVLDIGCFHGFNSFKAEAAGAKSVTGIELNEHAVDTVRKIAWLKRSGARFYQGDIVSLNTDRTYDIVLILNMLHHVKDIPQALKNVFQVGKLVVFEIPLDQEEIITEHANQFSFDLVGKANSHRADREIILFANPQSDITPPQIPQVYRYNYRKEYRKKLVRSAISFALKIKIFYPLVLLVRQYRKLTKSDVRPLVRYTDTGK